MNDIVVNKKSEEDVAWLGDSLREMRSEKKLTLEDVANGTGISINTLNKFELTGEGKTANLMRVLRFLDRMDVIENLRNVSTGFDPLNMLDKRSRTGVTNA